MTIDATDRRLLDAIEDGLPLVSRPFAELARRLALSEAEVIERLRSLIDADVIRRFGVVVRHRELGFQANAMVVWDIPEGEADAAAARIIKFPFITLCYRRPRRPPAWPYTLFCMVHGTDRSIVSGQIAGLRREAELEAYPYAVLFSVRGFKQCGARYGSTTVPELV
jgi:DNA-binding Lrp family transcriptional regulator